MVKKDQFTRLRAHRAPFYFGPEYLATAEEWQASFVCLLDLVEKDQGDKPDCVSALGYHLTLRFRNLELLVDAEDGIFDLREPSQFEDDRLDDPAWPGIGDAPQDFLQQLERSRIPDAYRALVFRRIKPFASLLHQRMLLRYKRALNEGFAEVHAMRQSPLNDPSKIDPDALEYFSIDTGGRLPYDLTLDEAEGPNGERLYSYGVIPLVGMKPETDAKARGGRPRGYDKEWLGQQLDALMEYHGEFTSADPEWNAQARLAEKAIEICRDRFGIDLAPATAKSEAKAAVGRYRERYPAKN